MTKKSAAHAFEDFTDREADEELELVLPEPTGKLTLIGQVTRILYRAELADDDIEADHEFAAGAGPYLVEDEAGEAYFGGGTYKVGKRGIKDGGKPFPKNVQLPDEGADMWPLGELAALEIEGADGCEWDEGEGPYILVDADGRMHIEAAGDDEEAK